MNFYFSHYNFLSFNNLEASKTSVILVIGGSNISVYITNAPNQFADKKLLEIMNFCIDWIHQDRILQSERLEKSKLKADSLTCITRKFIYNIIICTNNIKTILTLLKLLGPLEHFFHPHCFAKQSFFNRITTNSGFWVFCFRTSSKFFSKKTLETLEDF